MYLKCLFIALNLCIFLHTACFSQNRVIDSLSLVLKKEIPDTAFIQTLNTYAFEHYAIDLKKMKIYVDSALALATQKKYDNGIATSHWVLGIYHVERGDYDLALTSYLEAMKIYEKIKLTIGIARIYNSLGLLALLLKENQKALDYFINALKMYEAMQNQDRIATCLNNIGLVYTAMGKYEEAISNISRSMQINEKLKMPHKVAVNYNDAGKAYRQQGNYDRALQFFLRALQVNDSLKRSTKLPENYVNVASAFQQKKDYKQALHYYLIGIEKAKAIGVKEQLKIAYGGVSSTYSEQKNYEQALLYYQLFHQINDSLFNEKNSKQISKLQSQYQDEKQKSQITFLTKEQALQDEQKKFERIAFAIGLLLLSLFAVAQFRSSQIRKKINHTLSLTFKEIAQKNKNIISSINYAKRIQEAILPSPQSIANIYPESFVLFMPKDIVSGDFYYFAQAQNKVVIAAVDCTGHGVPGAFMSLIGNNLLKEIVEVRQIISPEKVLEVLNEGINDTLNQAKNESNKEGMEMALCVVDKAQKVITYAGAMNPIYFIESEKPTILQEIKGDKKSIGGIQRKASKAFTNHQIQLLSPTMFYLFSDGFQDQFGGDDDRKYTVKKFKELLLSIHHLPVEAQKETLAENIKLWQKGNKQTDDILVIGFKA